MVDRSIGAGFFETAVLLTEMNGPASAAQIRRAISSLYYAVYHSLALKFADALVGGGVEGGLEKAWVEVYRSIEHQKCSAACRELADRKVPKPFPRQIKLLAADVAQLYEQRLAADYDPTYQPTMIQLNSLLGMVEGHISYIAQLPERDAKALAVWVLFRSSGSNAARAQSFPRQ